MRERYSHMFESIVANLFANGLVSSVKTIFVSDSLKLSVSVEKNAVMLFDAKRIICSERAEQGDAFLKGSRRAKSNFCTLRFTR